MKFKIISFLLLTTGVVLAGFTFSKKNEQVKHVVVFKFRAGATQEQINEVTKAFQDLKGKIPGIVAFEHGVNISTEKKDLGFHHVYLITFENLQARDTYLPHPDHNNFGKILGKLGVVEDVFVVDFSAE